MRQRALYASAARTATPAAVTLDTRRCEALRLVIDVTAITATPSVVVTIDGLDRTSGKFFNLLTSAPITGVSTVVLTIALRATVTANVSASTPLPDQVRVTLTHGDADSITYSVAADLKPRKRYSST